MYHFALYFDLVLIIVIIVLVRVGCQTEYAEIIIQLCCVLELVETNGSAGFLGEKSEMTMLIWFGGTNQVLTYIWYPIGIFLPRG